MMHLLYVTDLIFIEQRHCAKSRMQIQKQFCSEAFIQINGQLVDPLHPVLHEVARFACQLYLYDLGSWSVSLLTCRMGGLMAATPDGGEDEGYSHQKILR